MGQASLPDQPSLNAHQLLHISHVIILWGLLIMRIIRLVFQYKFISLVNYTSFDVVAKGV